MPVPGETPQLHARAGARVENITPLNMHNTPANPCAMPAPNGYHHAKITLSWPLDNIGADLPNLMATVAGNLFELRQVSGLRLLDIRLPDAFSTYSGPQFGIAGTRALTAVLNDHADRTGKRVMYAFNITGEVEQMRRRHDLVRDLGGTCVMASVRSLSEPLFAGKPCVAMPVFSSGQTAVQAGETYARAIGIATTARSHGPDWMQTHLPAGFAALAATGARVVHYKVCSTLDSAPHAGSIGRALELGLDSVPIHCAPFLVAAPPMRRYQAFGHLFAAAGDGVFRLDRHPVMAQHPVTPMAESDVTRHLSAQTSLTVGNLQLEYINNGAQAADINAKIVALDCMSDDDLIACGRIIWPDTMWRITGGGIRAGRLLAQPGPDCKHFANRLRRCGGSHDRGVRIGFPHHRNTDHLGRKQRVRCNPV